MWAIQETADLIGKITLDTLFKAQSIPEDDEDAAALGAADRGRPASARHSDPNDPAQEH